MDEAYASVKDAERAFNQKWSQPFGAKPHRILFDFDERVTFTPDADFVTTCLHEYITLYRKAREYGPQGVRGILAASELMLGCLGRAHDANVPLPDSQDTSWLTTDITHILEQAKTLSILRTDGIKRIAAIASLLQP